MTVGIGIKLAPSIGNKLLGNASAVELSGIVRLTSKKMKAPKNFQKASCFATGQNLIDWVNSKFIGEKFGKVMTSDGKFTERFKVALNKTGYTLQDFAEFVRDMIGVGNFMKKAPKSTIKKLEKIVKKEKVYGPEAIMAKLENIKENGGAVKKLTDGILKKVGLTYEKCIEHCKKTINIRNVLESLKLF